MAEAGRRSAGAGAGTSGDQAAGVDVQAVGALGAVDHLDLAELGQAPRAVLHADPAPLEAAEGLLGGEGEVGVDPGRAALQPAGDVGGPIGVGAPHRAGQPEVGGVGPLDHVVHVPVGDDRQRRAELLLVDDPGPVGDVGEDGRLEEVAGAVHGVAAGGGGGPVGHGVGHQLLDPLVLGGVVDRAELGVGLGAVAHLDGRGLRGQALDHLVVERLGHVDALDGRAHLAVVVEGAGEDGLADHGGIGVVEHDGRDRSRRAPG